MKSDTPNMPDEVAAADGHPTQGSAAVSGSASIVASPCDLRAAAIRAWTKGLATACRVARSAITGVEGDRHAAEPSESGRWQPVPVRPAAPQPLERQGVDVAHGWRRWVHIVRSGAVEPSSRVSWLIEPGEDGVTLLTVVHDQLEASPKTAARVAGPGWMRVLSGQKTVLETGEGMTAAGDTPVSARTAEGA